MTDDDTGEDDARVPCGDIRALVLYLRERHRPEPVEVEVYHRDDDDMSSRPGPCPEPNPRYPSDPCPGHMETIQFCIECGAGDSGFGDLAYLEYPCSTIRALDDFEGARTGSHVSSVASSEDTETPTIDEQGEA